MNMTQPEIIDWREEKRALRSLSKAQLDNIIFTATQVQCSGGAWSPLTDPTTVELWDFKQGLTLVNNDTQVSAIEGLVNRITLVAPSASHYGDVVSDGMRFDAYKNFTVTHDINATENIYLAVVVSDSVRSTDYIFSTSDQTRSTVYAAIRTEYSNNEFFGISGGSYILTGSGSGATTNGLIFVTMFVKKNGGARLNINGQVLTDENEGGEGYQNGFLIHGAGTTYRTAYCAKDVDESNLEKMDAYFASLV